MRVLSVDLANSSYANLGIVILEDKQNAFSAWTLAARGLGLTGPPSSEDLATKLADACRRLSAHILLLDGPQGWKHPDSGLQHSRVCERVLNAPGKTGLPGNAKPGNYLPFIAFSIAVFQALVNHGFEIWSDRAGPLIAVETFPLSAWRHLGLTPLPAKAKARSADLQRAACDIRNLFPIDVPEGLSHDELQALVSAFGGMALARGCRAGYVAAGISPTLIDGTWREGFIINPTREALSLCG
jgi:hypothetical protein